MWCRDVTMILSAEHDRLPSLKKFEDKCFQVYRGYLINTSREESFTGFENVIVLELIFTKEVIGYFVGLNPHI